MVRQDYIHGFSDDEQSRLSLMQTIINQSQLREMDLRNIRSVLDVGSGLGQMSRAIARQLGSTARVLGIERSARQLQEANRQATAAGEATLVEFRQGDATDLPLSDSERGSFDLSHARFLLEHVPDPLQVVKQMVSATRIGGRLFLMDDDHELLRVWPPCPELTSAWEVYWKSYHRLGHDPLVGRRLPELLLQAGAKPTRISTIFYGAVHGQELFDPVVDNLLRVIASAADALDQAQLLTRTAWEETMRQADLWRKHAAASLWYSLPLAEGVRIE